MTDTLQRPDTPTRTAPRKFTVTAIEGETPDAGSHRILSEYTEAEWVGFLGPVTILFARRADRLLQHEHKIGVDVDKWGKAMRVDGDTILTACQRLVDYGLATISDRDPTLYISRHWPPVPAAIRTPRHRQVLTELPDTEAG